MKSKRSNCTFMELKLLLGSKNRNEVKVQIVPLWN